MRAGRGRAAVLGRGAPRGPRVGAGCGRPRRRHPRAARRRVGRARSRRAGPCPVVALHPRRGDDGEQRDRGGAAPGRRRRPRAASRTAGARLHRRRAGRPLPRPRRSRARRRPRLAQRPQGGRAGRHRRPGGGPAGSPGGPPTRRRPGARTAERHPGRGGSGRPGHRAAARRARARQGGAPGGRARGTGSARACWRRCPTHTARCPTGSPSCPGTCTCACRESSGRSCSWPSARRACAFPAARPVRAVRSRPAPFSPPWALPPTWQQAPSASRWGTARPMRTSIARARRRGRRRRHAAPGGMTTWWHTGRMRVLVAMSGGVDSSVAAALLVQQGHDVVGATLKLWGGPSDSGCCSVADVDDARRVAQQLGIAHHVFNLTEEFDRHVVTPYIDEHAAGQDTEPLYRVQPLHEVRPPAAPGRAPRFRPPGDRAPRPGHAAGPRDACGGAPMPPRTSPTCSPSSIRPPWRASCSRWVT